MKPLYAILALPLLCLSADADCRQRVVFQHHVQPVLAASYVEVPIYRIGYSSGADVGTELKALRLEIENLRLRQELQQLRSGEPQKQSVKSASAANCASCHEAQVAQAKGGGHVFFKDGAMVATEAQRLAMIRASHEGRMPKGGKVSDEVHSQIVIELTSRPK